MFGASLGLVFALVGSSPTADPAELVTQLGATTYAARESAEVALAKLGRLALPSLRLARKSRDLEIQTRATGLISRIEGALLVEPTMVELDLVDVPLEQAIKTINEKSGLSLVLNPDQHGTFEGRRLTLHSAEPLPFWKAIDAVCQAGQLHFIPGVHAPLGQREGAFLLQDGLSKSNDPCSDSGPFRVSLSSVHYQGEIQLSTARAQPFGDRNRLMIAPIEPLRAARNADPTRQFFLQFVVTGEPRLSVSQNGLAKVTVAVDDKGQSLVVPSNTGTFQQHTAGYNGMNPSPTVRFRLDLLRPEVAGQKIRLLRGTVPVSVATRKADPLEIPIADSEGKVFRNDDVTIALQSTRPARAGVTAMVELSITQVGQSPRPIQLGEGEPFGYRPDTPQQQIEILDAQGNSLTWFPSGTFYNGEETRLALTIVSRGKPPVPALIRYHSMIRTTAEVPFEFRNLPMP